MDRIPGFLIDFLKGLDRACDVGERDNAGCGCDRRHTDYARNGECNCTRKTAVDAAEGLDKFVAFLRWIFHLGLSGANVDDKLDALDADLKRYAHGLIDAYIQCGPERERLWQEALFWRGRMEYTLQRCVACENISERARKLIIEEIDAMEEFFS